MNSAGSKIILWGLILTMIAFTITRTLDFLKMTLPPGQGYIAYLGLVAFDVGVLGWLYYAMNGAQGKQRVLAYGMVFVCAGGCIVTTVCDLFLISSQNGLAVRPDAQMGTIALWVVCAVIAMNFLAGILVHLFDPLHINHMATEEAKNVIFKSSLEAIKARAGEMAPRIALLSADHWEQEVTRELIGAIPGNKAKRPEIVESVLEPVQLAQTVQEPEKKKRVRKLPPVTDQLGSDQAESTMQQP